MTDGEEPFAPPGDEMPIGPVGGTIGPAPGGPSAASLEAAEPGGGK
jgi:hypothetical protein